MTRQIEDGIRHEWKRPAAQRFLDEQWVDVDDPIGETIVAAGGAIVYFVGMQDVALTGQAVPLFTAVAECLHARESHADRISIVAMRRKSLADKAGLQSFDAVASRANPDPRPHIAVIAGYAAAQPFKTPFVAGG